MQRARPLVLLDTNALLLPFTRHFPLVEEVFRLIEGADIRVPDSVLRELGKLRSSNLMEARAALQFAKRFTIIPTDLDGDAAMETLAKEMGAWVVTADRELRERLESQGLGVLFPRGQRKLSPSWTPTSLRQDG